MFDFVFAVGANDEEMFTFLGVQQRPAQAKESDYDMTKSELIQKLADQSPHLFLRDIERIVDTIFDRITDALVNDDRVELRGFGAFSLKHREARTGRNPRTGETVNVDAKRLPFFKTGKALRDRLNDED